jgi:hypothetical protein
MLRGINTKHQYSSGSFKGFAASLTQPQVDTLKNNPNVRLYSIKLRYLESLLNTGCLCRERRCTSHPGSAYQTP